jgi:F-type H+-transporting ATPase subunit b
MTRAPGLVSIGSVVSSAGCLLAGLFMVVMLAGPALRADAADAPVKPGAHAADAKGPDHAEHATHGAEHAEHGNADPMSVDPDLAWCTLIVFGLLLLILKKFAWAPIASALDQREKTVADHIALAEHNHEEAKRLLAEYEAKLRNAQQEVRDMLDAAHKRAEQSHQELLAKARTEAEGEMARAKREIDSAKDQALIVLAHTAADQAVGLAGKILKVRLQADDHRALIEGALHDFARADGGNHN